MNSDHRGARRLLVTAVALGLAIGGLAGGEPTRAAGPTPVGLGTAGAFAVLAGSGITNTGASVIDGDIGSYPTTSISGFPPGLVNGTDHGGDAVTQGAKADLTTAYDDAAGRMPATSVPTELGGSTLIPGVYDSASGTLGITGTVILDGQGDPNAVFIFQTESTLITASSSTVSLIGSAQACNVFWQVGSSATVGGSSTFVGTILALTSITLVANANVDGRLLARNGAVGLDSNHVAVSACTTPGPSATPSPSTTPGPSATPSPSTTPSPSATPVASVLETGAASPTAPALPSTSTGPTSVQPSGIGPVAMTWLLFLAVLVASSAYLHRRIRVPASRP
jgi:hypothetical protein